ncbi:uncharacterized protein LOC132274031 [Cornus florida]|uniref:uncharacterized protein LOC132274031 n=1 Tax=Cornus florida TaxID=4283 RepID=UPI00289FC264|nr:uncharacterized protein LOC132274031 [Cornus florida]
MRSKANNQNKFMRFITIPIRVLSKAKDFYVRSLTDCAEKVSYGNMMGGPAAQVSSLPKSFSVNSSRSNDSDDLRELNRASSTKSMGDRVDMDNKYMQRQMRQPTKTSSTVVPRSCSVGMGRIDEDSPCDFSEDYSFGVKANLMYPRSRSHAVSIRSVVF